METTWQLHIIGQHEAAVRIQVHEAQQALNFYQVIHYWQDSPEFVDFYIGALLSIGYEAFFWEHPALKTEYLNQPYEGTLRNTKSFEKRVVNENAFSEYFNPGQGVSVFENLGKNALLIVPTQKGEATLYKHLGSFLRQAPPGQVKAQFQKMAAALENELAKGKLIWLNTAGLGVIWLHMRLDTQPKYYKTCAYKKAGFLEKE